MFCYRPLPYSVPYYVEICELETARRKKGKHYDRAHRSVVIVRPALLAGEMKNDIRFRDAADQPL
jgi:hypothetical protein